jgi:predicted HTH transcriptional regulator
MIPRPLNDITEADVTALIANGVAEGRTIDYKRSLPGNTDADKKEFLADTSSLANSGGGDLVFGMDEAAGLPTQIAGIQATDLDLEIRRLDSILAAGLSPRIRYAIKTLTTTAGQRVMIVRVERSWSGPHRVIFQQNDKFYGRNTAGKYALDVNELRTAFTLSNTVESSHYQTIKRQFHSWIPRRLSCIAYLLSHLQTQHNMTFFQSTKTP